MNILVINQDWFVEDWRKAGHSVMTMGIMGGDNLDIRVKMPMLHVDRLLELIPNGWRPDRIVILDNSAPVLISGLEETSIPVMFYSVDTHHHYDLHCYYAHLFDETVIAQRDYLHHFDNIGVSVSWMPLWASRYYEGSDEKKYGTVFVGGLDPKLNPDRVAFLSKLKEKVDVHQQMGEYWKIFPHAEVVLNQTVKRDLNFRVFEGMMSGSMLLTERIDNGLLELFIDGVELLTYEKGNVDDAAAKIQWALSNKEAARKIGAAGRKKILEQHLSCHRAELMLHAVERMEKRNSPIKYGAAAMNYSVLAKRFVKLAPALCIMCASEALKAAGMIRLRNEPLTDHVACYLISSAMTYDRINHTDSGQKELYELYKQYPDNRWLRYCAIRWLLNFGRHGDAEKIASAMPEHASVAETYIEAEKFILELADVH